MRHSIPPELARAYGKWGDARRDEEAWRTDPSTGGIMEQPVPNDSRHPIRARERDRRTRFARLNGWLQIALVVATLGLVFLFGFGAGALWEMAHWFGTAGIRR